MIDTKELRRLALDGDLAAMQEIIHRLEAAEKERDSARKLADSLALALNTSNHERDALRAEIVAMMKKQEPVAWCATDETGTVVEALGMNQSRRFDTPLGFLPRAKGEEK